MTSNLKSKAKPATKKASPARRKKAPGKPVRPKKPRAKLKGPQSLAAIARDIRKQPNPRNRMIDVLAYAAIKTVDQAAASEQTARAKAEQNIKLREDYQNALAASKEIAANSPTEKATARQRAAYEKKSNRLLEKLLLAKVALTLDVLGIPPTGKPDEDIYNIGMNCIGHLDYRFAASSDAPTEAEPYFFDNNKNDDKVSRKDAKKKAEIVAHKIAVAQYFNMVLYDLKTEDVLRFDHPELGTDNAVQTLMTAYQSIFVMKLIKKKPIYRVKRDIFKGEKRAADFIKNLEALEIKLGLMRQKPENVNTLVTEGRLLLAHGKPAGTKMNPFGFMKKLVGGKKK